jgi:GMP synthase (glutamine-hydrolysing)
VPFEVCNAQAGDAFPASMAPYRALAVLGGAMSANDDLPHLRQAEALIREAIDRGRPVVGHCLGGQLMARALGARVFASPAPEIGWQAISVLEHPLARHWFGDSMGWDACQWHYEAFDLPAGAAPLATSPACEHQAFVVQAHGVQHLAMQFHIEVDAAKFTAWSHESSAEHDEAMQAFPKSVSSGDVMRHDMARALPVQQAMARRVYGCWLQQGVQA